jgi:arginine utilization protein RocB
MLNSEPHQRKDPAVAMLSEGSVGKILPFVYVRGALAHAGQIFGGLNPVNLLSEVVRRIELNVDFCDARGAEVMPPPTCLFMKDSKDRYDVSIPRSAFACFNMLTLGRTPEALLTQLEALCQAAVGRVLEDLARNHGRYRTLLGEAPAPLPWSVPVLRFDQLRGSGPGAAEASARVRAGARTMPQGTWEVVEALLDQAGTQTPAVVIGFVPPYYPSVTNADFGDPGHRAMALADHLIRFAGSAMGQACAKELFYGGISDLSYASIQQGEELERALLPNMPLHGPGYAVPFATIRRTAMPCINIGPWGKDFHRLSERVHRDDLLVAAPRLIWEAVRFMLDDRPGMR